MNNSSWKRQATCKCSYFFPVRVDIMSRSMQRTQEASFVLWRFWWERMESISWIYSLKMMFIFLLDINKILFSCLRYIQNTSNMKFNLSISFVGRINAPVEDGDNTARMLLCRISSIMKKLGLNTTAHWECLESQ